MLFGAVDAHTVLYDTVTEMVHVLSPSAARVWAGCESGEAREALVALLADASGADPSALDSEVGACLTQLGDAGLVGRDGAPPEIATPAASPVSGAHASPVFAVIDDGVILRSDDADLLERASEVLDPLVHDRPVTVELGLVWDDWDGAVGTGAVRITGRGSDHTFGSADDLLDALPTALNQLAATSASCITLHAGALRHRDGEVVVLPAVSGSGKTTLTAALVQAGWDYLSDEAIGVRAGSLATVAYPKPLVLDARSREVLGLAPSPSPNVSPAELRPDVTILHGDVGPITRVVLPRYEQDAATELTALTPTEAVVAILEHALNLRRVGQDGLVALCELAEQVPVQRLVHGGASDATAALG